MLNFADHLRRVRRSDELTARECLSELANYLALPLRMQMQIYFVDQHHCSGFHSGIP